MLRQLHAAGVDPGATVRVAQDRDEVIIDGSGEKMRLPRELASRVFVARVVAVCLRPSLSESGRARPERAGRP